MGAHAAPDPDQPMAARTSQASAAACAAVAIALAASAAAAAERTLVLDPEQTRITFVLDAVLHKVDGSFRLAAGEVRFDPETGTAGGRIEIDAASGDTGNRRRDRRMHREVLDSERHPLFVFVPERVEGEVGAAGGGVILYGRLEIHGGSHPVEIPAWVEPVEGEDGRVHVMGGFKVPYVAWGLRDVSSGFLRVGKEVEVKIEAVADLSP